MDRAGDYRPGIDMAWLGGCNSAGGRMAMKPMVFFSLIVVWLATACTGMPPSAGNSAPPAQPTPPARTLVAAIRVEPKTIAARGLGQNTGVALYLSKRMFNADLALLDDKGNPQPY